jgi:diaminopimelate epimerase
MWLDYSRLEAAGNRYIAFDGRKAECDWSDVARGICDDRSGVGSDGIVVAFDSMVAPIRMRVFNSDGSEAEISGNGIRLFLKFCIENQIVPVPDSALEVETMAGVRKVWPTMDADKMIEARIDMGIPSFRPESLPCIATSPEFPHLSLDLGTEVIDVTCLSIGNPHVVLITDQPVESFDLPVIGEAVQNHAWFPNRTNFEVVNVQSRSEIRARIYERGEGETLSSGTGSSGSAIACRVNGLVDDSVVVRCSGGSLIVQWDGEGQVYLRGPTANVGVGQWNLDTRQWRSLEPELGSTM